MSFTYTLPTAREILHKPIEIKNVVVGVKHLKEGGIITPDTANAVINLIFTDITTEVNAAGFIAAAEAVQQNVHNYSGYLYKTTDELTAEMHSGGSLTDVAHVTNMRNVLNDVFDKMSAGYNQSASVAVDIAALKTDFYATPANTATYWANWELYETSFPYDHSTMDTIYHNIANANVTHENYMTVLADLMDDYPHINIEQDPMTRVARKLGTGVTTKWWFVATGTNSSPIIRIHPDDGGSSYNPEISYAVAPDGIILENATYTFAFADETGGAATLHIHNDSGTPGNASVGNRMNSITHGNSTTMSVASSLPRHITFEFAGSVVPLRDWATTNITGENVFIIKE